MLRNFEKFEVDHWYLYTGEYYTALKNMREWTEHFSYVIKRIPVKCKKVFEEISPNKATFYTYYEGDGNGLSFSTDFDNWIEIESPEYTIQSGDDAIVFRSDGTLHEKDFKVNYFAGYINGYNNLWVLKKKNENKEHKLDSPESILAASLNNLHEYILAGAGAENYVLSIPPVPHPTYWDSITQGPKTDSVMKIKKEIKFKIPVKEYVSFKVKSKKKRKFTI
jgi:hypothetical protein